MRLLGARALLAFACFMLPLGAWPSAATALVVAAPTRAISIQDPIFVGPLALDAYPALDGRSVLANVRLQNVLVGAQRLTASFPAYQFQVIVGTTSATGSITALFMPPDQLSTVSADVTVTVQGQTPQRFTGLIQVFRVPAV